MSMKSRTFDKIEFWSSIIFKAAIPIIIGLIGWQIQASISEQGIKKDYVQIAVGVLSDKNNNNDPELRKWAVNVISRYSPVPFTKELENKIIVGQTLFEFASVVRPKPPKELMEPPLTMLDPKNENLTQNAERSEYNSKKLKALQRWIKLSLNQTD